MRASSTQTIWRVVPSQAEFYGEGDGDGVADGAEDVGDFGQVAQQAGAAVAADDALGRAAEVEVDEVEAGVLDDAGGVGEGLGFEPKSCAPMGCSSS